MSAEMIDGRAIAAQIHEETRARAQALLTRGIVPGITFVRVGQDPASEAYVRMKNEQARQLGFRSETVVLPEETTQGQLLRVVEELNHNAQVHGILVQAPLPAHISETVIFSAVDPRKDVDGFHPVNVGKLLLGDSSGFRPCTPAGVHELLIRSGVELAGAEVVVLGRGNIVGKPMASILMQKQAHANSTVTVVHSRSREVAEHCRRADVLIAAMGCARFVTAAMVKPGAVVIDVGVNRVEDSTAKRGYRLVGDIDFDAVCQVAGRVTPNPGGVGPMTIAMLMRNTLEAAIAALR